MRAPAASIITAAAIAAIALLPATRTGDAQAASPANRIVVQVSDGDSARWNLALNNIRNLQKDLGAEKAEILLVTYGPGIAMLKADALIANRVGEALESGVQIVACENSLRGQKLTRDDMHANVGYVSSGVVEIMRRQQAGWAYLRP
jgi:intracellular sulfur oxidation DsrE/DsrF family protein